MLSEEPSVEGLVNEDKIVGQMNPYGTSLLNSGSLIKEESFL